LNLVSSQHGWVFWRPIVGPQGSPLLSFDGKKKLKIGEQQLPQGALNALAEN